jgi:N,N'-diacetyllegionaminate synthase
MVKDARRVGTIVIAEIGVNHNGSMKLAKELINRAHEAGANYAKFQTFRSEKLASHDAPLAKYQKASSDHGSQRKLLKELEFTNADFLELKEYASGVGIGFLTTAHDKESSAFVLEMKLDFVKVPSGDVTNLPFLERVAQAGQPVLLSTGMSSFDEVQAGLSVLTSAGLSPHDVTVMQCTTEYPAPAEEANLLAMVAMGDKLGVPIGYSDHTLGTITAVAAVALGASVIEKHLTSDVNLPGPDHSASLEPGEFREMVEAIRVVEVSLGDSVKKLQPSEVENRKIVRKSIVAKKLISQGDQFNAESLAVMRPGFGLSPMLWHEVIGQVAHRDFQPDEPIELS